MEIKETRVRKEKKEKKSKRETASPSASPAPSSAHYHHSRTNSTSSEYGTERQLLRSPTLNTINQVSGHFKEIHNAAFTGNLERLRKLLDQGANTNERAEDKSTPLHHASIQGHANCVALLLRRGTDVNATDSEGSTPLHNACFNNHVECVRLLLAHGADINFRDKNGSTACHKVAYNNAIDALNLILQTGTDIVADKRGFTPLHHACIQNNDRCLAILLSYPKGTALVDAADSIEKNTPLHLAAFVGSVKCVESLLKHGANPIARDAEESIPLHKAAFQGNLDVAKLLLHDKKSSAKTQNKNKATPLHFAAYGGRKEIVKLLIKEGANVNATDNLLNTPLHNAAANGYLSCCRVLLLNGADFTLNAKSQSPIDIANLANQEKVRRFLSEFVKLKREDLSEAKLVRTLSHGQLPQIEDLLKDLQKNSTPPPNANDVTSQKKLSSRTKSTSMEDLSTGIFPSAPIDELPTPKAQSRSLTNKRSSEDSRPKISRTLSVKSELSQGTETISPDSIDSSTESPSLESSMKLEEVKLEVSPRRKRGVSEVSIEPIPEVSEMKDIPLVVTNKMEEVAIETRNVSISDPTEIPAKEVPKVEEPVPKAEEETPKEPMEETTKPPEEVSKPAPKAEEETPKPVEETPKPVEETPKPPMEQPPVKDNSPKDNTPSMENPYGNSTPKILNNNEELKAPKPSVPVPKSQSEKLGIAQPAKSMDNVRLSKGRGRPLSVDIGFQQRTKELHKEKEAEKIQLRTSAVTPIKASSEEIPAKIQPAPKKYDEKLVVKAQKMIRRHQRRNRLLKWKNLVRTYANSAQATVMKLRNSACKEIIHSEVTFLTNLLFISKNFKIPLEKSAANSFKPILQPQQISVLFGNLDEIIALSKDLVGKLNGTQNFNKIGKIFADTTIPLQKYMAYVINFDAAIKLYNHLISTNEAFVELEKNVNDESGAKQTLIDNLLLPVQRCLRLKILFGQLKEYTPLEHVDRQFILQAASSIEKIYNDIQQVKKGGPTFSPDLLRIKEVLKGFPENLVQPKRRFLKEGLLLTLRSQKKQKQYEKFHAFLFSDILILSTPKQSEKGVECHFAESIRLEVISEIVENKTDKGAFDVFFFGVQEPKFTFSSSAKEKVEWMQSMNGAIKELLKTEEEIRNFKGHRSLSGLMETEYRDIKEKQKNELQHQILQVVDETSN